MMRRASKCCGFFISMFFFPHNLTQMMDRFDTIDESTQLEGKLSIVASGRIWLCIIACGDWCSSNNDSRHIGTFLINRRRMRLPLTISFPCNVIRCEPQSFGLIRNGRILCYFGWMLDLLTSHTNSSQCWTVLCRIIVPVHIISTNEVINTSFTSRDRTTRFDVIIFPVTVVACTSGGGSSATASASCTDCSSAVGRRDGDNVERDEDVSN